MALVLVSIGDLTTQAMRAYLEQHQGPVYRIRNMEDIAINRQDLASLDGMVIINNVERLTFEPDVDWPLVQSHIHSIENVEILVIPRGISKFQILTNAKNVENIRSV
ncbi:MAG: hypothetical protein NT131_01470 [Methanomassiliicoccales archaeon]|nr:hypothetical protein [Methanomassiliicoccales archaeon]